MEKEKNIFNYLIKNTSKFNLSSTNFFEFLDLNGAKKLIYAFEKLIFQENKKQKIFIANQNSEKADKISEIFISLFEFKDTNQITTLRKKDSIFFPLFAFASRKVGFDYSIYISENPLSKEISISFYKGNMQFLSKEEIEKMKFYFEYETNLEFENIQKNNSFSILKIDNIVENFATTLINDFMLRKNDSKILNIGFLNKNNDIKLLQQKIVGKMDLKFNYSPFSIIKSKMINKLYFNLFKKSDVLIDYENDFNNIIFYVKNKNKYIKISDIELFITICHFLNTELNTTKILMNNELFKIIDLEVIKQRLLNKEGINLINVNLDSKMNITIEQKTSLVFDNPFKNLILFLNFLNYCKTQNLNFEKIRDFLKKIYKYNELEFNSLTSKINLEKTKNIFFEKGYKLIFEHQNDSMQTFYCYFENKMSEKIWFFYNFSFCNAKIMYESKKNVKYNYFMHKLIKRIKNDNKI
ncbi:hypothetical protein ACR34G_02800 [Mycoplasma sp. 480]|uniref:hypothetical protein n=1 Tax=Mycoplasma sp. 480 TaxID=3440155 RepID=UPI003F5144BE